MRIRPPFAYAETGDVSEDALRLERMISTEHAFAELGIDGVPVTENFMESLQDYINGRVTIQTIIGDILQRAKNAGQKTPF